MFLCISLQFSIVAIGVADGGCTTVFLRERISLVLLLRCDVDPPIDLWHRNDGIPGVSSHVCAAYMTVEKGCMFLHFLHSLAV